MQYFSEHYMNYIMKAIYVELLKPVFHQLVYL